MRTFRRSRHKRKQEDAAGAEFVATVWLVFYGLAIGAAISAPFISHALEIASK